MKTQACRRLEWIVKTGFLSAALAASPAFAQGLPQQDEPAPRDQESVGEPMNRPAPVTPMPPGMPGMGMRGRGMNGPPAMPGGPESGRRDHSIPELLNPEVRKELAITEDQRQKLEDIRFNSEKESIQHRSAIQIRRMELERLSNAENPDRAAIDTNIQELAQEEAALMRSAINAKISSRAVLTPEQSSKISHLRRER